MTSRKFPGREVLTHSRTIWVDSDKEERGLRRGAYRRPLVLFDRYENYPRPVRRVK